VSITYTPVAPAITSLSVATGPVAGGTAVTITGTNLFTATNVSTCVKFGGVAATSIVVVSNTSITCVSPAGTGTVDVKVTTNAGTSSPVVADQFTYTNAAGDFLPFF
jgi:uncharacterized protein (TIGR03437 family)